MDRKQGRNAYRRQVIAEFDALFPPQMFRSHSQHGNTSWTPRKVVWLSMIMFWLPDKTLSERFRAARHVIKMLQPHWKVPISYAGFVESQRRLWPLIRAVLLSRLRPDESMQRTCRILGWLVLAVDGSRFECPRTTANEEGLGCAGKEKTAPQLFHTLLQHVGTGLPWDFRVGPGTDSERHHLAEMLAGLPEQTLLTADAGFISYALCSQLIDEKRFFILRIGGNKTLIEQLDENEQDDHIVAFWPQNSQHQPPLKLRRICFPSTGGLPVVLVTNILDTQVLSDEDARTIYQSRWGIEVFFRHLKQTMDFGCLSSRTPETSLNEQNWRFVSFWMLQRIVVTHQITADQDPRRFSAARARREIREVLQLMQQQRNGPSLRNRCLQSQTDNYQRTGTKTTRNWPRKKNDTPPKPPKTRTATKREIQNAKRLGFKILII